MVPPSSRSAAAFCVALLAAACAGAPSAGARGYERRVAVPVHVAAAVTAGAMRHLLPFADPVPQAGGAPVEGAGDAFRVVYERRHDGPWVPRASHRLRIDATGGPGQLEPLAGAMALPGFAARADERLLVHVRGDERGTVVTARLPVALSAAASLALDRALTLAVDPGANCAGLAEPNLAAVASQQALRAASAQLVAGEPAAAQALLLQALRLGAADAAAHHQLAELAASGGDTALARTCFEETLLRTADPVVRARAAARLALLTLPTGALASQNRAPWTTTGAAGRAATAARLHTARRQAPEPVLDYRLASLLHRQREDDLAALATALLAREHERAAAAPLSSTAPPVRHGLDEFVRRLVHGVAPVAADAGEVPTASAPAAAPAR